MDGADDEKNYYSSGDILLMQKAMRKKSKSKKKPQQEDTPMANEQKGQRVSVSSNSNFFESKRPQRQTGGDKAS